MIVSNKCLTIIRNGKVYTKAWDSDQVRCIDIEPIVYWIEWKTTNRLLAIGESNRIYDIYLGDKDYVDITDKLCAALQTTADQLVGQLYQGSFSLSVRTDRSIALISFPSTSHVRPLFESSREPQITIRVFDEDIEQICHDEMDCIVTTANTAYIFDRIDMLKISALEGMKIKQIVRYAGYIGFLADNGVVYAVNLTENGVSEIPIRAYVASIAMINFPSRTIVEKIICDLGQAIYLCDNRSHYYSCIDNETESVYNPRQIEAFRDLLIDNIYISVHAVVATYDGCRARIVPMTKKPTRYGWRYKIAEHLPGIDLSFPNDPHISHIAGRAGNLVIELDTGSVYAIPVYTVDTREGAFCTDTLRAEQTIKIDAFDDIEPPDCATKRPLASAGSYLG